GRHYCSPHGWNTSAAATRPSCSRPQLHITAAVRLACTPIRLIHTRPPPTPTLSPYTTLFRSSARSSHRGRRSVPCPGADLPSPGDRKSTRLNSSHVKISYAVFCLKKKMKKCSQVIFATTITDLAGPMYS